MSKLLLSKKIILVLGDSKKEAIKAIETILKDDFLIFKSQGLPGILSFFSILRNEVIIIEDDSRNNVEEIESLFSSNFLLLVTETKKKRRVKRIISKLSGKETLLMDYTLAKKIKSNGLKKTYTFGISRKSADFYISNIGRGDNEINFKLNQKGNIVPFWVKEETKRTEIYAILSALCVGSIFQLNLAEMSHKIRKHNLSSKSFTET